MPKTAIAPIIAVIVLVLGSFGIHIGDSLQAQIVDWVVLGVAIFTNLWGIWKNHHR